jgi:glycosyltransferase involved in cell wall biosynthesis
MSFNELHIVPQISVVMPSYNEEKTIGSCIVKIQDVFQKNNLSGEIIVSDSSTDKTAEIASSLNAVVVHSPKRGYGNAYHEGLLHARSDHIVMMDSDGTYDPSDIPNLIKPLGLGADLVIGSRFNGMIYPGAMTPLHRYIGNPLLTWILNIIFHTNFSDTHSGFRAIKRDVLEKLQLKSEGMEYASEMLIMASIKGMRIEEVPISYFPRKAPSNLRSFTDGWRHLRFILLVKPVPFIAVPGLMFSVLGTILMGIFYLNGNIETSHLHAFIMGSILLIGGIQILTMGISTEIYSIIHGYQKKRPFIDIFLNYHSLEKFLLLGAVLIFTGIVLGISILLTWITSNYGEFSQISTSILALSLIVIGIQVITCSIFISMMLLNTGTEIL